MLVLLLLMLYIYPNCCTNYNFWGAFLDKYFSSNQIIIKQLVVNNKISSRCCRLTMFLGILYMSSSSPLWVSGGRG